MTVPLYWRDQSLMNWSATVLASSPEAIVLDESAFFPGGGGQPADVGQLEWAGVFTRIDGVSVAGLVPAEGDPLPPVGTIVQARLDDVRRRQLMRTHSGLHVVCGVVYRDYGALALTLIVILVGLIVVGRGRRRVLALARRYAGALRRVRATPDAEEPGQSGWEDESV